jgi:hypothetical protein
MNYAIGRIIYSRLNQRSEAIPYLFAAYKSGCELRDDPELYRYIGAWYLDEAIKLGNLRAEKIKAADGQETEEIKADEALVYGYLDRAIDAYSRAYSSASAKNNIAQPYKDGIYEKLGSLFDSRYDGKRDGMDKYVAEVMNSPFIDPLTPVKPVVDPPFAPVTPAAIRPSKTP